MCQGLVRAGGSLGAPEMSRPGSRRPGLTHCHSQGQPWVSGTILGTGTGQVALLSVALRQGRAVVGWRGLWAGGGAPEAGRGLTPLRALTRSWFEEDDSQRKTNMFLLREIKVLVQ